MRKIIATAAIFMTLGVVAKLVNQVEMDDSYSRYDEVNEDEMNIDENFHPSLYKTDGACVGHYESCTEYNSDTQESDCCEGYDCILGVCRYHWSQDQMEKIDLENHHN